MKVKGINGLTVTQVQDELVRGGKFVQYSWCISLLIVTYRYLSAVYFIRKDKNVFVKGLPYTIITLLLGWWSVPYGVFFTFGTVCNNINGKSVTQSITNRLYRKTGGYVFEFEATKKVALA